MKFKNLIGFGLALILVSAVACKKNEPVPCPDGFSPTPYVLVIPPFFPPMDIPENNPITVEGVDLGRHLFWEKELSGDNTLSCGSCHLPENGFSDPAQFSTGITGEQGNRQSMALVNLGWARDYFWDGRALTLEDQIREPVPNPIEMNQSWEDALEKLRNSEFYPGMFAAAFGDENITEDRTVMAIAQFLRTMISADSKFDQWKRGEYTLTDSEYRGYDQLFLREGGDPELVQGGEFGADCFHCHTDAGLQFSDYLPHNNGLDSVFADLGYGGVNGNPLDYGKFKAPSLRNVELSAPYMHDGRFNTLEEVIDHYNSGGLPSETIDSFMKYTEGGLMLGEQSKIDLVNFLKTLTDTSFIHNPSFQDPHE
jgi:cytochrome c peroxidase